MRRQSAIDDVARRASIPSDLVRLHCHNNRTTAASWERFAGHRQRVTELALAAGGTKLALLGAGNCNDVDLQALAQRYREIHLVDIDREALRSARDRMSSCPAASITLHGPVDVSGVLVDLARLCEPGVTERELGSMPRNGASRVLSALPGGFDTVLSASVLSQMMHSAAVKLGAAHPLLPIAACAMAVAHLRAVVQLLAPGGVGIIVTDTLSSSVFPLEDAWKDCDPNDILEHADEANLSLSGTAPSFVRRILGEDEVIAPLLESSELARPWLWRLHGDLTLLVYAYIVRRRPSSHLAGEERP